MISRSYIIPLKKNIYLKSRSQLAKWGTCSYLWAETWKNFNLPVYIFLWALGRIFREQTAFISFYHLPSILHFAGASRTNQKDDVFTKKGTWKNYNSLFSYYIICLLQLWNLWMQVCDTTPSLPLTLSLGHPNLLNYGIYKCKTAVPSPPSFPIYLFRDWEISCSF